MVNQDPMEALRQDPNGARLLADPAALKALLESPEAKTLAELLQQAGGGSLQQAAQDGLKGDGAALGALLRQVQADPRGARAMADIRKKTGS